MKPLTSFSSNEIDALENVYPSLKKALKYIYGTLFERLTPDVSGYYVVLFNPPELSGLPGYRQILQEMRISDLVVLLATQVNLPEQQMNVDEVRATVGGVPYATEVNTQVQFSISYTDTNTIRIYDFHVLWFSYIEQVLSGALAPASSYYTRGTREFGSIDYMASFFVIRYTPDGRLLQVTGLYGVFPLNQPTTDVIGNKIQQQITTITVNYTGTFIINASPQASELYPLQRLVISDALRLLEKIGA